MLTIYRTPQPGQVDNPPAMQQAATMQKGDWLNLVNPTPEEIRLVSEQTGIAEEFIRYPLDDEELARVETEDGQILIIVDVPVITDSPVIYDTTPLGIVLNDDFFVTISLNQLDLYNSFAGGRVRSAATFKKTRLTLQILQIQTNIYLKFLRDINRRYEALEARLAYEVTKLVHGEAEAEKAQAAAQALFAPQAGANAAELPGTELPAAELANGLDILALLSKCGLIKSNGEGRRLIADGGVYLNNERVAEHTRPISEADFSNGRLLLRKGKKVYHQVIIK